MTFQESAVKQDTQELLEMLTYRRPAGSKTERTFIKRFIAPLGARPDARGNYWLTIGESPILWSCHTDTVHREGGTQKILFGDGFAALDDLQSNCLGADDTAGVWLLKQMIKARVPGTYVFHYGEEKGGVGSNWIANHTPERLKDLQFAIAFDRRGTEDIITEQLRGRTASEKFAKSMAEVLGPLEYSSCPGTYTDTANYSHLIPECSNLSVGYHNEHTQKEWLDVGHLTSLRDQLLQADFSKLVCARDPSAQVDDFEDLFEYVKRCPYSTAKYLQSFGIGRDEIENAAWFSDRDGFDGVYEGSFRHKTNPYTSIHCLPVSTKADLTNDDTD